MTVGPYIGQLHSGQQFGQWIPTFRGGAGCIAHDDLGLPLHVRQREDNKPPHGERHCSVPTSNCTDYKGPYWDRSIIPQKMCSKFGFVPLPYWIVALKVLLVQVLFQTFGCMSLQKESKNPTLAKLGGVGQTIHDMMAKGYGVLALQLFTVVMAFIQIIGIYKSSFVCADGWDKYNQMVRSITPTHTFCSLNRPPLPQSQVSFLHANNAPLLRFIALLKRATVSAHIACRCCNKGARNYDIVDRCVHPSGRGNPDGAPTFGCH